MITVILFTDWISVFFHDYILLLITGKTAKVFCDFYVY